MGCGQRLKGWIRGCTTTQSPSDLEFYNRNNLDGEGINVLKDKTKTKPLHNHPARYLWAQFLISQLLSGYVSKESLNLPGSWTMGKAVWLPLGFCLLRKHLCCWEGVGKSVS